MIPSKKSSSLIALLLLTTTFNAYSMEPKPKKKSRSQRMRGWITTTGQVILGNVPIQQLTVQEPFLLAELPKEQQKIIIGLLTTGATAESLDIAAHTINSLAQVNKELNALINDPKFCLQIIKNLAKKFHCSDFDACSALQTERAKYQLALQKGLLRMCQYEKPSQANLEQLLSNGIDLEFTCIYQEKKKTPLIVTPLMLTSILDNKIMTSYLLSAGANINNANENGTTALMFSVCSSGTDLSRIKFELSIIEQFVTNPGLNINQQDKDGNTALLLCIKNQGLFNIINTTKILLQAGADPEISNNEGETPLVIARRLGNKELIIIIRNAINKKHGREIV